MLHFKSLKLNGFKSFVDRTEIDIGPGMTGIIGPNGCGKSNILDGLRWAMGEASAKKMRGSEMEDVIFSGSASRSRRTTAEVTITLDNASRTAPAAYNGDDIIEISRKIERDSGSLYKVNGRTVRARDVQFLFADTLSGAHSPALVSQGRITTIISAKPIDRRQILEDSAGISGLYARRHEAELRLRAADENLVRLEDVLENLNARYNALHRQAREAQRYKDLGQKIRKLDKDILYIGWLVENDKLKQAAKAHEGAEKSVQSAMKVVSQLTQTEKVIAEELPKLREKEAEAAASFQAYNLSIQRLDDEEERIKTQINEIQDQLQQIESDYDHTQQVLQESSGSLEKIQQEQSRLCAEEDGGDTKLDDLQKIAEMAREKASGLDKAYQDELRKSAEQQARFDNLKAGYEEYSEKLVTARQRLDELKQKLDDKKGRDDDSQKLIALRRDIADKENALAESKQAMSDMDQALEKQSLACDHDRQKRDERNSARDAISHEYQALESIQSLSDEEADKPAIDEIDVQPGFEESLSVALGASLKASLQDSDDAKSFWRMVMSGDNLPPLPDGATPLSSVVKAPPQLKQALDMIGLVQDMSHGESLYTFLKPGQALVDRAGNYWRWDGFIMRAGSGDQSAQLLKQKNRLAELEIALSDAQATADTAQKAFDKAQADYDSLKEKRLDLGQKCDELAYEIGQKQKDINHLVESQSAQQQELARLEEALNIAENDVREIEQALQTKKEKLDQFDQGDDGGRGDHLSELQDQLEAARAEQMKAEREYETAAQESSRREARLRAIADERLNIQNRKIRAAKHIKNLEERREKLKQKLAACKSKPGELNDEKSKLLDSISELKEQRNNAAEALAKAESQSHDARQALKDAEESLADARENRAHAQAAASAAKQNVSKYEQDIEQKFDWRPASLIDHTAQDEYQQLERDELTKKEALFRQELDTLTSRRNALGAVNLRAEEEIKDIEKELQDLEAEHEDLTKAVAELRQGIQKLNKEARERLLKAFDQVNSHFQNLFVRLFNGGKAYLSLIDADDPLESGLEIYAQPPGKSLQSLSLLSGGEQTLTAIALIFAMFLTNPSPICILDEIDAPLDDNNVDRVCNLLEEVSKNGNTRFIVITHHRLTMARMDRLYGVTMAEKGVSKLVSVDMHEQMDLLETAEAV